jgi:2-phosphosulfolactate phosphatase
MNVDVVFLPHDLQSEDLAGKSVVVFDVLRATTTMAAALSSGVKEIRIFGDLESATVAAHASTVPHLLCGERHAVKPVGFDLGNSPGVFDPSVHRGLTLFMATTNGTRAIVAAARGEVMFVASLVNASTAADALLRTGRDVTLLCSGTEGEVSLEDVLGAGAVMSALDHRTQVTLRSDRARLAHLLFLGQRHDLLAALRSSRGGQNIIRAGLTPDIAFCSKLDSLNAVGVVAGENPIVTRWNPPA